MKLIAYHHVAVRVADLERSTRFYTEVLPGRVLYDNEMETAFAQEMLGADAGMTAHSRFIGFEHGSAIELFAFTPSKPIPPSDPPAVGQMHFCLWVDDVPGTIAAVQAGGGRQHNRVQEWHGHHVAFVADPDGHLIELVDITIEESLALRDKPPPETSPGTRLVGPDGA